MAESDKIGQKGVSVRVGEEAQYVVDGVQQVDSSQSGGSVTQKGRRSAEVAGDVFFNPLLDNNLQYMQDSHRTYQAIRQYRIQQLKRNSLEVTERVAPAKIISPFAEGQKQMKLPSACKQEASAQIDDNYDDNNNKAANFALQKKQSPRSTYDPTFSDTQEKNCTQQNQQPQKLSNQFLSLLVQDSVKEMKHMGKELKVLQWVFATDEQLYSLQNGEECSDWATEEAKIKKQHQHTDHKCQKQQNKCGKTKSKENFFQQWSPLSKLKQLRRKQSSLDKSKNSLKSIVTSCFGG